MTRAILVAALLALASCAPDRVQPLHVAYAGDLGGARAQAAERFLAERFARVTRLSLAELASADLSAVDVLVVDGEPAPEPRQDLPRLERRQLALPTVLVGAIGGEVAGPLGLGLGFDHG